MNRRQLLANTGVALGALVATNNAALAALRAQADSTPNADDKPDIVLADYSPEEALYLGALFTWLELLKATIDELYVSIDALEAEPDSMDAKAAILMHLGVWSHLRVDTQKFDAPGVFATTHPHVTDTFRELGHAADVISTGVVVESPTAVTLGTAHIEAAAEHVGQLIGSLPFNRPTRSEVLG